MSEASVRRARYPSLTGWTSRYSIDAVALCVALALLYAPTLLTLFSGPWQEEEHAYSPFILVAAGWLAWRVKTDQDQNDRRWGAGFILLLLAGSLVYLAGRLLGNIAIETASILIVVPAAIGLVAGPSMIAAMVYPLLALIFVVPLPGSVTIALTFPLKMAVSTIAAFVLQTVGLPVSRQGIMIDIGNYQLLVADACSGLQSMYSLAVSAVIYLALVQNPSRARAIMLLMAVLPIAFAANVCRVIILALITYFWGDAAGQGFLHGFAGIVMFAIAFASLMVVDRLIDLFIPASEQSA